MLVATIGPARNRLHVSSRPLRDTRAHAPLVALAHDASCSMRLRPRESVAALAWGREPQPRNRGWRQAPEIHLAGVGYARGFRPTPRLQATASHSRLLPGSKRRTTTEQTANRQAPHPRLKPPRDMLVSECLSWVGSVGACQVHGSPLADRTCVPHLLTLLKVPAHGRSHWQRLELA